MTCGVSGDYRGEFLSAVVFTQFYQQDLKSFCAGNHFFKDDCVGYRRDEYFSGDHLSLLFVSPGWCMCDKSLQDEQQRLLRVSGVIWIVGQMRQNHHICPRGLCREETEDFNQMH